MESNNTLPPAGWYPDPNDIKKQRYWNGATWTSETLDLPKPTTSTLPNEEYNNNFYSEELENEKDDIEEFPIKSYIYNPANRLMLFIFAGILIVVVIIIGGLSIGNYVGNAGTESSDSAITNDVLVAEGEASEEPIPEEPIIEEVPLQETGLFYANLACEEIAKLNAPREQRQSTGDEFEDAIGSMVENLNRKTAIREGYSLAINYARAANERDSSYNPLYSSIYKLGINATEWLDYSPNEVLANLTYPYEEISEADSIVSNSCPIFTAEYKLKSN
jgi:hypothetical protein